MDSAYLSPAIQSRVDRATGLILRQSHRPHPCEPGTYWSAHQEDALCKMTVGNTPEEAVAKWRAEFGAETRIAA